jgi:hypothetical protein
VDVSWNYCRPEAKVQQFFLCLEQPYCCGDEIEALHPFFCRPQVLRRYGLVKAN